jgi:hypothetical protein
MPGRSVRQGKGDFHCLQTRLTIMVVVWWLLLGGSIIWIMPGPIVTAEPALGVVMAGETVRIAQSGGTPLPAARDRASFNAMRLAIAARYEDGATESVAEVESVDVEAGQTARVLMVDGDAVLIELLDGDHIGELAWVRSGVLRPAR